MASREMSHAAWIHPRANPYVQPGAGERLGRSALWTDRAFVSESEDGRADGANRAARHVASNSAINQSIIRSWFTLLHHHYRSPHSVSSLARSVPGSREKGTIMGSWPWRASEQPHPWPRSTKRKRPQQIGRTRDAWPQLSSTPCTVETYTATVRYVTA